MAAAIRFDHVGKRYRTRRDHATSFRDVFVRLLRHGRVRSPRRTDFWALQDVSFEVGRGETIGLIGANGAGKSTVLKLVSRLTQPTRGEVCVHGRVMALLELGAGFHPDLTGRENVHLSGALIGMSRADLRRRFDDIVAFAEMADYIDLPVKHYSSGMFARLAFAVSIHLEPEILLVDEVLAVGDLAFQTKCLDKFAELKRQGVTIVLVTHSHEVIRAQCNRALWIDQGRVRADGAAEAVVQHYVEQSLLADAERLTRARSAQASESAPPMTAGMSPRWGSQRVQIERVFLTDAAGQQQTQFETGQPVAIHLEYSAPAAVRAPVFGIAIHRQDGLHVTGPNTALSGLELASVAGRGTVTYTIPALPLLDGLYQVSVSAHNVDSTEMYDYHDRAYLFRVVNRAGLGRERFGLMTLSGSWKHQT